MTLRIIQISDTHLSNDAPQRALDLEHCVQKINEELIQPDLIVHTGDISHNGLHEEYLEAQRLLNVLKAPYFVMPGNRDKRNELLNVFADDQYQIPPKGWVQYSIEKFSVRLLMVDTVCEHSNKGQLCDDRLEHLETMLKADPTKPVALFLHHTPFEAAEIPDPFQFEDWSDVDKLRELLQQHKTIGGVYCGHVHRSIDGEIAGIKARAISCLAGDLRKGKVSDADRTLPVFRTIELAG